jgi:hypothetical protein
MILYSTTPHSLLYLRNSSVCLLLPRCTTLIICFTSGPAGLLPNRVPMDKLGIRRASAHTSFNQGLSHFMDPSHSGVITLSGPPLFQGLSHSTDPLIQGLSYSADHPSFRGNLILQTFPHSGAITLIGPPLFQGQSHSTDLSSFRGYHTNRTTPLSGAITFFYGPFFLIQGLSYSADTPPFNKGFLHAVDTPFI